MCARWNCVANAVDISNFPWDHLLVSSLWDALIWQWWIWKPKVKTSPARSRLSCRFIQTVQADRWARDFLLHFIGTLHIHRINFHKLRRFNFVLQRLQSPRTLSASWSMRSTLASYNQTVICTAQPDQQIQYVSIVNSIGSWYLSGDVNIREVFVLWPTALIYPPVMAGTATYYTNKLERRPEWISCASLATRLTPQTFQREMAWEFCSAGATCVWITFPVSLTAVDHMATFAGLCSACGGS